MKNNQLVCLLVPTLALALPADIQGWADGDNGNGIVVGVGETTTSPGGFSSVAHSRAIPMAPSQRHSHHHRNIHTVQPLLR